MVATYDPATIERAEHMVALLKQQQQMLLRNQWPQFMSLKQRCDLLLREITEEPHDLHPLPHELQERLKQAYQYLEWILITQKHQTQEQLRKLRQRKPAVKAYRSWDKTKQKSSIAAM